MSKPTSMPEIEWQSRCELAALYRLTAYYRMTDLIDTHITLRVPGPERHFLINRYGVAFEKMRASDLVLIDLDGKVVESSYNGGRVNTAGFIIHSAIHDDQVRAQLECMPGRHRRTHAIRTRFIVTRRDHAAPVCRTADRHGLVRQARVIAHLNSGIETVTVDVDDFALRYVRHGSSRCR